MFYDRTIKKGASAMIAFAIIFIILYIHLGIIAKLTKSGLPDYLYFQNVI